MRLIVKFELPGERPNRRLDAMAAIAGLVRAQTVVPTFDVIAVDVSREEWPWEYLIVTQLPGVTWQALYPRLDASSRADAQRQIGRAAAELHTLAFDSFGEIGPDGLVADGTAVVDALKRRALRRITTPRYRDVMLDVLDTRADLFANVSSATLCHEDMNPYNLVFELREGQPVLSGILDFESAWASTGESDLARLELWWFTAGARFVRATVRSAVLQMAMQRGGQCSNCYGAWSTPTFILRPNTRPLRTESAQNSASGIFHSVTKGSDCSRKQSILRLMWLQSCR
jgi:aminoglycoside phosphotransferase (APT) family kinase protein